MAMPYAAFFCVYAFGIQRKIRAMALRPYTLIASHFVLKTITMMLFNC